MTISTDEVIRPLAAGGVLDSSTVEGCSEPEIAALEKTSGVTLPRAYRAFLAAMGKSAGEFFCGTDFLYTDLPLREYAEDLLNDSDEPLVLDADDFVFAMHQGYTFLFFRCGVSDDPAAAAISSQAAEASQTGESVGNAFEARLVVSSAEVFRSLIQPVTGR